MAEWSFKIIIWILWILKEYELSNTERSYFPLEFSCKHTLVYITIRISNKKLKLPCCIKLVRIRGCSYITNLTPPETPPAVCQWISSFGLPPPPHVSDVIFWVLPFLTAECLTQYIIKSNWKLLYCHKMNAPTPQLSLSDLSNGIF